MQFNQQLITIQNELSVIQNAFIRQDITPKQRQNMMELANEIIKRFGSIIEVMFEQEVTESPRNFTGECAQCHIYVSMGELRNDFGSNADSILFGLNGRESRKLYHELLPECIVESEKFSHFSTCQKAKISFMSRKAIKKYVREKSGILSSVYAKFMDYWRHGKVEGVKDVDLWNKKAKKIGANECVIDNEEKSKHILWSDFKCESVCHQILKSSLKTNKFVDHMTGIEK